MKIIKSILIGLGSLFLLIIVLFAFLLSESNDFFDENKAFVETFSYDLTRNWRITDVHDRLSNELIKQLDSIDSQSTISKLSIVGSIREIYDMEMGDYKTTTEGTTGIISFKAKFERAKGVMTITLLKKDNKVFVHGFHLSVPDGIQDISKINKA